VWSGGGVEICTGQFFYSYASCTVYTGVSLWRSFRNWQELPQELRSGRQGLWMPSDGTSKYQTDNAFRFLFHWSSETIGHKKK